MPREPVSYLEDIVCGSSLLLPASLILACTVNLGDDDQMQMKLKRPEEMQPFPERSAMANVSGKMSLDVWRLNYRTV